MISFFCLILISFAYVNCASVIKSPTSSRLLIVSFDGFRHDYLDVYKPTNFMKFAERGVIADKGIYSSFPTKTFPNHYTIVTGLYPEKHGIVDNKMYDEVFDEVFTMDNKETKWFDAGEPIWITGRLQGLNTSNFNWVGGSTILKGTTATYFYDYDKSIPFYDRIDTVINWFENDAVSLSALYFEEPDGTGHKTGTFSEGVRKMIAVLDDTLGYLLSQMEKRNLLATTDIILISDHGMTNISRTPEDNLILQNYISKDDFRFSRTGTVGSLFPYGDNAVEAIYNLLKNAHPNVEVYLKNDVPEEFHFRSNRRIPPIVLIGKEGFVSAWKPGDLKGMDIGQHGYDNHLSSMRPIFLAAGPSFRQGITVEPFGNVNVYPLMCHLLNIQPSPNNGSLNNVISLLK